MPDLVQSLMSDANSWVMIQSFLDGDFRSQSQPIQKPLIRIGMWPITSDSSPELGMGVGLVLASLLEQWRSVCVYRLLAMVDEHVSWQIAASQFGVDDWELEGLDENAAFWGEFEITETGYHLVLEVESDAVAEDVTLKLEYSETQLEDILSKLPDAAKTIMQWIDSAAENLSVVEFGGDSITNKDHISDFLRHYFQWELAYFLELGGIRRPDNTDFLFLAKQLVTLAQNSENSVLKWATVQSIARILGNNDLNWSEKLQSEVAIFIAELPDFPVAPTVWAVAMFCAGNVLRAYDVLESSVTADTRLTWRVLGDTYYQRQGYYSAIDACQRAIEAGVATDVVYIRYGELLDLLSAQQVEHKPNTERMSEAGRLFQERLVLISSEGDFVQEAVAAYKQALELNSDNVEILGRLNSLIVDSDTDSWKQWFIRLVEADSTGEYVDRLINENLPEEVIRQIVELLEVAIERDPKLMPARINLVRAYMAIDETRRAGKELAIIRDSDISSHFTEVVARLQLSVNDHDFERHLGEIRDTLDAQRKVSEEDTEYLETIIEEEPYFVEGYRLLAESYVGWGENEDALEILLDCQKQVPNDPGIVKLLAQLLWAMDEESLALGYLDQGLASSPNEASLLAVKGRFLFDQGYMSASRDLLIKAENLDLANADLAKARVYISRSRMLADRN